MSKHSPLSPSARIVVKRSPNGKHKYVLYQVEVDVGGGRWVEFGKGRTHRWLAVQDALVYAQGRNLGESV